MVAGFARLQQMENGIVPALLHGAGVDWVLECAPASSPSPALDVPRHRMLMGGHDWIWPCRAACDGLPFGSETLPAILIRHLFWHDFGPALLADAVRCLKPGGLLVSVSANPWHVQSWRELGRDAMHLPAWPRLLMQHARHRLLFLAPRGQRWRGFVPGIHPLLVVVARKPPRTAPVRRLRLARDVAPNSRAVPTSCRAA